MVDAKGPIFAAGFEHISNSGYGILYLPDIANDELQRAGKAPVYWWLPNEVRLARKQGDTGDYKFSFTHFVGRRSAGTTIGASEDEEVSGGLLGFSTTASPPDAALLQSQNELLSRFRGSDDRYWGWRTSVAPMFRPAPIVSNQTSVTSLSPNPDGSVPAVAPGATRSKGGLTSLVASRSLTNTLAAQRSVKRAAAARASNLDTWYTNLQGQGSGSVNPRAENAYSGLMGAMPAALVWSSFHGGTGGLTVWQHLKIKVWSPMVRIKLRGSFQKIQDHFSAAAHASGLFWSADVKAEFNNLVVRGDIEVVVEVDTTLPNAEKYAEEIRKRSDLVFEKFMDWAKKCIIEPAPFESKPAEASGGVGGFGGGGAFKFRRDQSKLELNFEERREMAYLQEYPISGQLTGLADEIKADPANEKKYFTNLYIDDWDRAVARVVKPVVNWPDPARKWAGQPVSFLSVQIGYPNTNGEVQWDGHAFQAAEGPDAKWSTRMAMKPKSEVSNPPPGWEPDKTYLKRRIHFSEPPSEAEDPFVRMQVEKNVVDLDPAERGTLVEDINLEVRVDQAGVLALGPMFLGVSLEDAKQTVTVRVRSQGQTADGKERPWSRFLWRYEDQDQPRYFTVVTGDPTYVAKFEYEVEVTVKGTLFTKGMSWTGPLQSSSGSGQLIIAVPTPDEAVSKRDWQGRSLPVGSAVDDDAAAPAAAPAPVGNGAPPPRPSAGNGAPPPRTKDGPPSVMRSWSDGSDDEADAPPARDRGNGASVAVVFEPLAAE